MSNEYFITIINTSPLPVNVETWQSLSFGLSEMKSVTLQKDDRIVMSSETGEWFVNSFIYDKHARAKWESAGYQLGQVIGKFRSEPSINGENVWMCNDNFQIICSNGLAKISKKE